MSQAKPTVGNHSDAQDPVAAETLQAVQRWAEAYILRDIDEIMAAMTEDCLLETPTPSPEGKIYQGKAAVRAFWEEFFRDSSHPTFETEEMSAVGDRCIFRWVRRWTDEEGNPCHLRGIDVFRVRGGKIAEKLAYTKSSANMRAVPLEAEVNPSISAVQRFCAALNLHDIDAVMESQTQDCVLDVTYPYPDGTRYQGQEAVREFWKEVFQRRPTISFESEEMFAVGDRCILRFVCRWTESDGTPGHFRGADVYRVRDGKVAEKLAYQKRNR